MTLAAREARLRRTALRNDFRLTKNRSRTPDDPTFGGYMLLSAETDIVVAGADPLPFSFDLDDVEHWLTAP